MLSKSQVDSAYLECLIAIYLNDEDNRDRELLIDMRHPNSITLGDREQVFVGDNKGTVHIFELRVEFTDPV